MYCSSGFVRVTNLHFTLSSPNYARQSSKNHTIVIVLKLSHLPDWPSNCLNSWEDRLFYLMSLICLLMERRVW